eukprot:GEMP01072522.1.p1 GENE.GEMP01072522.1~~GEMP01072522.1.p1  ORF type:complete len:226 (+),score=16.34 GEMP01072522.1:48-680(+)
MVSLIIDVVMVKRGKEIAEKFIDIACSRLSSGQYTPKDICKKGRKFRDEMLPKFSNNSSNPDALAALTAEYDRLQCGETFTAWYSYVNRNVEYFFHFDGQVERVTHKKVEAFSPCRWEVMTFNLVGSFKCEDANTYEKTAKRILGKTGFEYIRRWKICEHLFARKPLREEPLTADESECVLEYQKYRIWKEYGILDEAIIGEIEGDENEV